MRKIFSILKTSGAVFSLVIIVGVLGTFISGAVSPAKIGYIGRVIEGTLVPREEKSRELTFDEKEAEAGRVLASNIEAREKWNIKRQEVANETSRLTSYLRTLRSSLEQTMRDIDKRRESLRADIKDFEDREKGFKNAAKDEGFEKKLEVVGKLEADQAAIAMREWDDNDIVRLFMRLKSSKVSEIITELNGFPAKSGIGTRGAELLEKLDKAKTASNAGASVRNGQARQ